MSTATVHAPVVVEQPTGRLNSLALLPWVYALTLFVSATLLFVVQPMFAKMVLPLLGGTPAVWNTCVVFFQAALLAGYLYSHLSTTYLRPRAGVLVHLGVMLLPWLVLPISLVGTGNPPTEDNPIPWLLALLTVSIGLPFLVVSTSAPLLQRWFADTGHPSARDPYFLYAASNVGSMIALLGYPVFIEPHLSLAAQSVVWTVGYALLSVLVVACVGLSWCSGAGTVRASEISSETSDTDRPAQSLRLRWVALGLVPSSLMLGVTTHMTTDVAAIPLLWVLPLALYLLTFILVFSRLGPVLHPSVVKLMPMVTLLVVGKLLTGLHMPLFLDLGLHLSAFFVISLMCHGELARTRPGTRYLTEFYLLMSLGGVLGGLFNALVAPVAFDRGLEYPIVLALACLLLPRAADAPRFVRGDVWLALVAGLLAAANSWFWGGVDMEQLASRIGDGAAVMLRLLPALIPLGLCFMASARPVRFGLAAGALLIVSQVLDDPSGRIRHRARGFFGQMAVRHDPARDTHWLVHGTTLHGKQSQVPALRQEPLTYFHRTGPMGQVFALPAAQRRHIGITGLGMGSLACYARPGQEWTFYEIDPVVARVAEDENYFTCLADARRRGAKVDVIMGDARLRLVDAPNKGYDLLILDSFSSDSVPMHLISHEAVQLYLSKLADDGVMVFNISNRYLDLEPVLARVAEEEGLTAYIRLDRTRLDEFPDKTPSRWVVMARKPEVLAPLWKTGDWQIARTRDDVALWRDDFSNLLGVFMWREQ